jgi:hypothetical protein
MSHFIENGVSLASIAAVNGQRNTAQVEKECQALGIPLGVDWSGAPAVTQEDARSLVSGSARAALNAQREAAELRADCKAWEAQRDAAVKAAADAASEAAQQKANADAGKGYAFFAMPAGLTASRDASRAASEAAHAAGREFELTNVAPGPYVTFSFIEPREAPTNGVSAAANKLRRKRSVGGESDQDGR